MTLVLASNLAKRPVVAAVRNVGDASSEASSNGLCEEWDRPHPLYGSENASPELPETLFVSLLTSRNVGSRNQASRGNDRSMQSVELGSPTSSREY